MEREIKYKCTCSGIDHIRSLSLQKHVSSWWWSDSSLSTPSCLLSSTKYYNSFPFSWKEWHSVLLQVKRVLHARPRILR
jgi:hypothetical protein